MIGSILGGALGGSLLVIAGVLCGALADRIRGRRSEPRQSAPRAKIAQAAPSEDFATSTGGMGGDVVRALVTAGYSKPAANAAMNAAPYSTRSTLESWTRAALACARKDNAS